MSFTLERGQRGEDGYYRLTLDLPLLPAEVRRAGELLAEEGWSDGEEIIERLEELEGSR